MTRSQWEITAPYGTHCCGFHDEPEQATWTLLNPADGGDPLYYCEECKDRARKAVVNARAFRDQPPRVTT